MGIQKSTRKPKLQQGSMARVKPKAKLGVKPKAKPKAKPSVKPKAKPKAKLSAKSIYKKFYYDYIHQPVKLQTYQKVGVILLIVVISGFVGWVWEFALIEIEGGFRHLYIKGGNILPWISIYAYGALLIILVSYKLRRYPWAVFIVSAIATGLLELFAGWVVYTVGDGTRYWDYREPFWGLGNIDGFVCPASAAVFGLGALLLMYWLLPRCIYWAKTMNRRVFLALAITLFAVIIVDDVANLTLRGLGLPTAHNFYQALGWVYKE